MTKLFILASLFSLSYADNIESTNFNPIFKEALLFMALFSTMSLASFFISRKNAKAYELSVPLQDRIDAAREKRLVSMYLNHSETKVFGASSILIRLSQQLEDKDITQEEFQILKRNINTNLNT